MSTTTHLIEVDDSGYLNVSNGNLNCTIIIKTISPLRCVVDGSEPDIDETNYIEIHPGSGSTLFSVTDLIAEDDVWIRTEQGSATLRVIRGEAKVTMIG